MMSDTCLCPLFRSGYGVPEDAGAMMLDAYRQILSETEPAVRTVMLNFLNPFAFITFRPEHFLYFCPYLNEAAVTDGGRRSMMLLWTSESNLI